MSSTARLQLPLLLSNQAQKDVTVNQALMQLDALVQLSVISRVLATPPAFPSNEDAYIVPAAATGAWVGQTNSVAIWVATLANWIFLPPFTGWQAYSQADNGNYVFNGNAWLPANQSLTALMYVIDGGGYPIGTGLKGFLPVPFNATIQSVELLADAVGTATVDIYKCTTAQFDGGLTHPISTDSITASSQPAIGGGTKYYDGVLSGWTTAINAQDVLAFYVIAAASIFRMTITLQITRL